MTSSDKHFIQQGFLAINCASVLGIEPRTSYTLETLNF